MKRIISRNLLLFSFVFLGLFLASCSSSQDEDYILPPDANLTPTEEEALADCERNEFLTEECVEILQSVNEKLKADRDAILDAFLEIGNVSTCHKWTPPDPEAPVTTGETVILCDKVAETLLNGEDACARRAEGKKGFECEEIVSLLSEDRTFCADGDPALTVDYCALIVVDSPAAATEDSGENL